MIRVWHYDGASAIRYDPELIPNESEFHLSLDDWQGGAHLWSDLIYIRPNVYGHKSRKGWRIGFDQPPPVAVFQKLPTPAQYGFLVDKVGFLPAMAGLAAISVAFLAVALKAPEWLAPLVPMSVEKRLGNAMVGDFGGRVCNGPGGQAALTALVQRIEPDARDVNVRVVNIDMVNAVALPGGNIFVFEGLLKEAKSADELAGVLGHEIGHVKNRDVMRSLLRQMGLSIVLGGASSDLSGGIGILVASTYSREAESLADQYAIKSMQKANVSPLGTASFFARMGQIEKKVLGKSKNAFSYLSSHPLSETREKQFRDSAGTGAKFSPSITNEQWQAIVNSCKNDPNVKASDTLFF